MDGRTVSRWICGFCCVALAALTGCGSVQEFKRTDTASASAQNKITVIMNLGDEFVTIMGTDGPNCEVTTDISARTFDPQKAKELAEKVAVEIKPLGDTLVVDLSRPTVGPGQELSVRLRIKVPEKMNVKVTTGTGRINCSGVIGDLVAKSGKGQVSLFDCTSQQCTIETRSGPIELRQCSAAADVFAKSWSGNITASQLEAAKCVVESGKGHVDILKLAAAGDVFVKSKSGHVAVSELQAGQCGIDTAGGHISVRQCKTSGNFSAKSKSGDINASVVDSNICDIQTASGRVSCSQIAAKITNINR